MEKYAHQQKNGVIKFMIYTVRLPTILGQARDAQNYGKICTSTKNVHIVFFSIPSSKYEKKNK